VINVGGLTAQEYKFAVILVLDIDHPVSILASPNSLSINYDTILASHNGEWNKRLAKASEQEA
jgi:hypothetical protein